MPPLRVFAGRDFVGDFYELTCGLTWRPHSNVIVRPELRFDWYDGAVGAMGLPFNDGASDDQLTFAVDAIVTF